MGKQEIAEISPAVDNNLKSYRLAKGLSQQALAMRAGVTRQAVCAIEGHQYLPTTAVALHLARVLGCRVEDLFCLPSTGQMIEGEWARSLHHRPVKQEPERVKIARVGERFIVRPVSELGEVLNFTVPADGLVIPSMTETTGVRHKRNAVQVQLLRDRREVEEEVVVAGCDPAIFLVGEYLRRRRAETSVVGWTLGSVAALEALKQGEVHIAGLHIVDPQSGESNIPFLKRNFKGKKVQVVTFASWEQGLLVKKGNPKGLRQVEDVAQKRVICINREEGAGARFLFDDHLTRAGIPTKQVRGYDVTAFSHIEVARHVSEGRADVGIGLRSAAQACGLDFIPLQVERYDLVIPNLLMNSHPSLRLFLDTLVSKRLRSEIEALGGYDTRETGKIVDWPKDQGGVGSSI